MIRIQTPFISEIQIKRRIEPWDAGLGPSLSLDYENLSPPVVVTDAMLLEDNVSIILLEDNSSYLLLEA